MDDLREWGNTLAIIGRLKPNISMSQAQAEAKILYPQLRAAHPEWFADYTADFASLKDYVSGKLRRSLFVLWGAVGLILLIVCVNLANRLARSHGLTQQGIRDARRTRRQPQPIDPSTHH